MSAIVRPLGVLSAVDPGVCFAKPMQAATAAIVIARVDRSRLPARLGHYSTLVLAACTQIHSCTSVGSGKVDGLVG